MGLMHDPETQRSACTPLDALHEISKDAIEQYLQLIMEQLAGLLDTAPIAVKTVVTEAFSPCFADMMKPAFQGVEMGSARLRECSFLFFGVMAWVFGEEFAPYLPSVVPPLLQSCKQAEHGEDNTSSCTLVPSF
jgi:hypothetical protein